jgi:hypothetical protein
MTPGHEPPLTEFIGDDVVTWLVEYRPDHVWAILWGGGQNVVRAWPDPQIGLPCYAEAADLDAARIEAKRIAMQIVRELGI